jgi:hypothetical protein
MSFGWPAPEVEWAMLLGIAAPFVLLISRWLLSDVAKRFGVTAIVVIAAYILICLCAPLTEPRIVPIVTGGALIVSALVFVLGVWGVLTRGYSVALLITLERSPGPMSVGDLEAGYSGGRGLRWLADKRLSGLKAARAVDIVDGDVRITRQFGAFLLWACGVFQKVFRLKDYG